jgi:hypothetical protein
MTYVNFDDTSYLNYAVREEAFIKMMETLVARLSTGTELENGSPRRLEKLQAAAHAGSSSSSSSAGQCCNLNASEARKTCSPVETK